MKIRSHVLAAVPLALVACRSSGGGNNPDAGPTIDGSNSDDTSIYDIQDPTNKVAIGQQVNVRGVVVTAIDNFGAKKGDFWVEEPAGGAYSGVHVYGADVAEVDALAVGDLVDITGGVKNEFALSGTNADPTGRTVTELQPASGGSITVTKTGTGTVPDPAVVDALTIGQMTDAAAQDAEWEKWEGVLIKLQTVAAIGNVTQIGGSTPDPTFQKLQVTGPIYIETSLAALPTPAPAFGDCFTSVTGVEDYFYDYLILPRSTDEVATGGSGCPVAETGATACGDGVDNDANGHADCADFSCDLDQPATCVNDSSVADINMGTTPAGAAVNLKSVYVTAMGTSGTFWAADALAGAPYNGIEAYKVAPSPLPAGMAIGSKVDVDLVYVSPYHGLNELAKIPGGTPTVTVLTANAGAPTPAATTIATLADATNGPHYVGTLVTITNAKVTAVTGTTTKTYTLSDGTNTIEMGDAIFSTGAAMNTCYASITGIESLDTAANPSLPQLLPRQAADLTTGGTCN